MVNKQWYKPQIEGENTEELVGLRSFTQNLIDLYCQNLFKEVEDITPNNLQQFLEIILKNFFYYHIDTNTLLVLGDTFDYYFDRAFRQEFPETFYPSYPQGDRRSLALLISDNCLSSASSWPLLPEEVPFLLECLNAPDNQVIHMGDKINSYFKQFDVVKRCNIEERLRWQILKKQRIEALQKGAPLPIKPMGLELDLCYKNDPSPRRGKLWEYIYLNYSSMLSEKVPEVYEAFLFGSEADAENIVKNYNEILINRCRECGSIKSAPGDNMCSSCWASSHPLLGRK